LEPIWGETFELESHNPEEEYLRFYVFEHEAILKDHLLSWGEISIKELRAVGHIAKGYQI